MSWWHLGCFLIWLLWVVLIALTIHVQIFVRTYVFISLGKIPSSRIAGSYDTYFNLLWNCQTISKAASPSYIPTSSMWMFHFLYILVNSTVCLFYYIHRSGWEVVFPCGFGCISPWLMMLTMHFPVVNGAFFPVCWPFVYILWRPVCLDVLPIFQLGHLFIIEF